MWVSGPFARGVGGLELLDRKTPPLAGELYLLRPMSLLEPNPASVGDDDGRAFLVHLGELLHAHGTPAMRLEEALTECANKLGIHGQFLSTPTSLLFGFGEGSAQRTHLARVEPGDVDIGRLADLDEVIDGILDDSLDARLGLARIEAISTSRRRYPRWSIVPAFGLAAGTAACFFRGGELDILLSTFAGIGIGLLALMVGGRRRAVLVFESVAALLTTAIGTVAAAYSPEVSSGIITLSGLIVLVPGLTLTVAMSELASRHLVAGTARLAWAATIFLSIALGVGSGRALQTWFPPLESRVDSGDPSFWTLAIALALAPIAFAVLFRSRRRDMLWVLMAGWLGFLGARVGTSFLGAELGVLGGSLLVGLASNLYARLKNRPAVVLQVPGIMLLVPGSIGFASVNALLRDDVLTGVESAFDMAQVGAALVGGLLFANALLRPRRSL